MPWITVMAIMAAAVLIRHLGLIAAVEDAVGRVLGREVRLPVVGCSKCLSFWATAAYVALTARQAGLRTWEAVAMPPLMAYAAYWLELLLGWLDTLYDRTYDALYTDAGDGRGPLPAGHKGGSRADKA